MDSSVSWNVIESNTMTDIFGHNIYTPSLQDGGGLIFYTGG